jgi:hypothetical protein
MQVLTATRRQSEWNRIKTRVGPITDPAREIRPRTARDLFRWVDDYLGVKIGSTAVCQGHSAPADVFASWWFDAPPVSLVIGSRGSGKSYLSGIHSHLCSRWNPNIGTRILGGSKDQSRQIYEALKEVIQNGKGRIGNDRDQLIDLQAERAFYRNGSDVRILAASRRSVRGPHVPFIKLDEIDELDEDLREHAFGMAMEKHGIPSTVIMTSTWHRVGGPVSQLIKQGHDGAFPVHTWCVWEVLERCPESRSGRWVGGDDGFEKCPECPLKKRCHEDRHTRVDDLPKAKRSDGHYTIGSLIQKLHLSNRILDADYFCLGPKADGVWFNRFNRAVHVQLSAEFDPKLKVYASFDSGVCSGGVLFQVRHVQPPNFKSPVPKINIFADYYSEDLTAFENGRRMLNLIGTHCNGQYEVCYTDPAGGAKNPIGPTVLAELKRSGLSRIERWPSGGVVDGLGLLDSFIDPGDGLVALEVHPRCQHVIDAFEGYARDKRAGQYIDKPKDPQHPHEDLIDPIRGGIKALFPEGRKPESRMRKVNASQLS